MRNARFAPGEKVLVRPWWSERALIEAVVLNRYAADVIYYRVRPTGRDAVIVPAERLVALSRPTQAAS